MQDAKRTDPLVGINHPEFKWTTGADVQATWRKYGWTPPSEGRKQYVEPVLVEWEPPVRRVA